MVSCLCKLTTVWDFRSYKVVDFQVILLACFQTRSVVSRLKIGEVTL